MNKILHGFYLLSFLLCPLLVRAQSDSSAQVVVLKTANQEIISAFPILDNTIIKFERDSIEISKDRYRTKMNKENLFIFDLAEEMLVEVKIKILTNNSLQMPIEGLFVTLHNEYDGQLFGYTQVSDNNGIAYFRNIPVGYYTTYVTHPQECFYAPSIATAHYGDNKEISMLIDFGTTKVDEHLPQEGASTLYNLNGQVVKNATPGIYIQNGKKVIVR